jgi:hypothetical protein
LLVAQAVDSLAESSTRSFQRRSLICEVALSLQEHAFLMLRTQRSLQRSPRSMCSVMRRYPIRQEW